MVYPLSSDPGRATVRESGWDGGFLCSSHLITTQSCGIRQGPVFTASYWHYHWAASLLSFSQISRLSVFGIISRFLLFNIFSTCLLYPSLFQTVSLIKSSLCLGFSLLCSLFRLVLQSPSSPRFSTPLILPSCFCRNFICDADTSLSLSQTHVYSWL